MSSNLIALNVIIINSNMIDACLYYRYIIIYLYHLVDKAVKV